MRHIPVEKFYTINDYADHTERHSSLEGPNGSLLFVACDAGQKLAEDVQKEYQDLLKQKGAEHTKVPLMKGITARFEGDGHDGTCPCLTHNVSGSNVYVFQNCMDERRGSKSINDNFQQLLQMIYTLKTNEAKKVTAIVPYYPYSRQDKPSYMKREASLSRLVADQFTAVGTDLVISYHPHSTSIISNFGKDNAFRFISGNDLFLESFKQFQDDEKAIVVSTDAGGAKEVSKLAEILGIGYCIGNKDRPEKKKTKTLGISSDVSGKETAIITDDETATFSSCLEIIKHLHEKGIKQFYAGISHLRIGPDNVHKLREAHEKHNMVELHTTDSVPQLDEITSLPFIKMHSLAQMWAFVINRRHYNLSGSKLFKTHE